MKTFASVGMVFLGMTVMAVAEPLLLTGAGDLKAFAGTVLLIQAVTAMLLLGVSLARK